MLKHFVARSNPRRHLFIGGMLTKSSGNIVASEEKMNRTQFHGFMACYDDFSVMMMKRTFHQNMKHCRVPVAATSSKNPSSADEEYIDIETLIAPPKNQPPLPEDYVLLYRNPKARFFKFAFIASIANAITLSILAYFTITMVKFDELGNRKEASLTSKILIGLGYALAAVAVIAGVSYYAKHNILEFGRIDDKTVRIVTAKFGWSNYKDNRIPIDEIKIPLNSVENLKYNLFLTDNVAAQQLSEAQVKSLKRKGDYVFVGLKGKKWNHIMDITAEDAFVDKNNFLRFLEYHPKVVASSIPRSGKGYNPYKNY
ncbi:hypothetical protein FDP41_011519 [Naegleria fowleri]|uniref:Uncharacterized protein n=1 Tax=Naegleria fowleri TaxID=5763 RepID=A0A6A5CBE8_NAEFO|nr:uncharacterized protein FDP41_011519 [Naegleria fowleri]KAF0982589.1 hypothetical protein FDP41_011519 [Naegleria fowleri]CAG4714202.1 unnamed protein product [Naegleria fowleri]